MEVEPEVAHQPGNCVTRSWARLRARPRLFWLVATCTISLWIFAGLVVYLAVPQIIITQRIDGAQIDIKEGIVSIGPNADSEVFPVARVGISKSVMQMPLISFKAHIKPFTATIWWRKETTVYGGDGPAEAAEDSMIGTMRVESGVDMDSSRDVDLELAGKVEIPNPRSLAEVVNHFIKDRNMTFRFTATVDVRAYIYGWIPVPFNGISIGKYLTIPAFNNFKEKPIQLKEFLNVHGLPGSRGLPGQVNVTASANVYNPSPVTMVLKDSMQIQIFWTFEGQEYRIGVLNIDPPLTLKPGDNAPSACARVAPEDSDAARAITGLVGEYVGPQHGLSPAGTTPLLLRMGDGYSKSPLIEEATQFLSVNIDFRPYPVFFILAVTCDIIAFAQPGLHFYRVVVHVRVKNPVPQVVHLKKVGLEARHLNLQGPPLYHYNRDLDPKKQVLQPYEEVTLDFELNPLTEISWGFLFSPTEIAQLLSEAAVQNISGGLLADLTVAVNDGYVQIIPYHNEAISVMLCFRPFPPSDLCGGLPPGPR